MRFLPLQTLSLLILFCACGATGEKSSQSETINRLVVHGHYQKALVKAQAWQAAEPDNEAAVEAWKGTTIAVLLDEGRQLTFDDDDMRALLVFEQAAALDPDSEQVAGWLAKAHRKLADRWLQFAHEAHTAGRLGSAIYGYERALEHQPGYELAENGVREATIQNNYRLGLADEYYVDGVTSQRQSRLDCSRREFSAVDKYNERHKRGKGRRTEVEVQLAEELAFVAEALEQQGLFDAARNEFRLALELDPENAQALAGKERAGVEARAADFNRQARMAILKGRLEEARELNAKGRELSEKQVDSFDVVDQEIEQAGLQMIYDRALNLERDYRYPEAIKAFGELLQLEDYYLDARARMQTLEFSVKSAKEYYTKATAATTDAERLINFRAAFDSWPAYSDVEEQIKKLED